MNLRELIGTIGREYDPVHGLGSPTQQLLRRAGAEMMPWIPPGYIAHGSGGQGGPAFVPWIAVFDPDETDSAQRGMYVVYLFAIELGTVVLSLNQGVTELVKRFKTTEGRQRLAQQATAIRQALPPASVVGLTPTIELPATAARPVHYRYGNIVAKTYAIEQLPSADVLAGDLRRFITLYETALDLRETLRRTQPDVILTTPGVPPQQDIQKTFLPEFKPKSDAEYQQQIAARLLVKSRKHETLVREYGDHLANRGFVPATNVHPRDMLALRDGETWLIEVKMVRRGDGMGAAREALGQLLAYRYLHHYGQHVHMAAVFSENIGNHSVGLLEAHGVVAVWRDGLAWRSSQGTPDYLASM